MEEEKLSAKHPVSGMEFPEFAAHFAEEQTRKLQYTFTHIRAFSNMLERAIKDVESILNNRRLFGDVYDSTTMYEDINEALEKVDEEAMHTCCSIYYQYSQPIYVSPFRSLRNAEEEDLERFGQNIFGIYGTLYNEKILFALPMLGRRISYLTQSTNGTALVHDYSTFFTEDVSRTMKKIIEELGQKYSEFRFKTVSFFFVHEPEDTHKLDADSHDTKAIIDAIVSYLPCGDAAGYCDFTFVARESETLLPGTYICISKGLSAYQSDSILEEFEAAFPSKQSK